jgi:XTP/dITP diphosphohydrolase
VTEPGEVLGSAVLELIRVQDRLRRECPWDAKQTHASLAPYLLEETYEALDALDRGELAELRGELGDVLLQVVFHSGVASERTDGTGFDIDDVARGIAEKLIRRHPHVFGDVQVADADEVRRNWDMIKKAERAAAGDGHPGSVLDGVPMGQPALSLAAQLQRRAQAAGVPPQAGQLPEDSVSELGAELFALVAKAQVAGLNPELELRNAARVFRDRVQAWEFAQPE